jgi:hypothetical protein
MAQPYQLGQNLFQTSNEELQNLAAQKGLTQAPSTPLGTNSIGGTPKQADMTGSKAQKQALLGNAGQQPKQTLQQAQATQQPSSALTQQEQAAQQKSQQLNNLGSLGSRVQSIISGQLWQQSASSQPVQSLEVAENPNLTGLTPSSNYDPTQFKSLLEQYSYNQDPNTLAQINTMLGRTQTSTLSAADIQAFYKPVGSQVGSQLAAATPDTITVGQVDPTKLGFQSADQMAQLLNIPLDQIASMSLTDLQTAVKAEQQKEFSNIQGLKAKIADPNIGDAERQQAQQQLAQMSQAGVTGTEAQVGQTANQVANADTVTLAGKSYQVKDLLSDQGISDIVSAYLNNDPADADWRKQLEAQSPDLVKWIQSNQAQLTGVMTKVGQGVKDFQDIQTANEQVNQTQGTAFSDDVMKAIVPTWGQISGTKIDPNSIPLLQMANDTNNPNAANIAAQINDLSKNNPEVLKELGGLSADQLKNLGLNNPSSKLLDTYSQYKKDIKDLNNIPDNDVNTLLDKVFGNDTITTDNLQPALTNAINEEKFMGKSTGQLDQMKNLIDANHDGIVDDPATIKQAMINYLGNQNVTLTDLANGTSVKPVEGALSVNSFDRVNQAAANDPLHSLMGKFDGSTLKGVTTSDISKWIPTSGTKLDGGANYKSLQNLSSTLSSRGIAMDSTTQNTIKSALNTAASDYLNGSLAAVSHESQKDILADLQNWKAGNYGDASKQAVLAEARKLSDYITKNFTGEHSYDQATMRAKQPEVYDQAQPILKTLASIIFKAE